MRTAIGKNHCKSAHNDVMYKIYGDLKDVKEVSNINITQNRSFKIFLTLFSKFDI